MLKTMQKNSIKSIMTAIMLFYIAAAIFSITVVTSTGFEGLITIPLVGIISIFLLTNYLTRLHENPDLVGKYYFKSMIAVLISSVILMISVAKINFSLISDGVVSVTGSAALNDTEDLSQKIALAGLGLFVISLLILIFQSKKQKQNSK